MRYGIVIICTCLSLLSIQTACADIEVKSGPSVVPCFDVYEIIVESDSPPEGNPFTDVQVSAAFTPKGGSPIEVDGFCDDQEGKCFRVRFCPSLADTEYRYALTTNIEKGRKHAGSFRTTKSDGMQPVVMNPEHPKHFQFASSGKPFYHMGLTAYHLLDISNNDKDIRELLDYCVRYGFNKVRFLLTGYPRDNDTRNISQYKFEGDLWKLPNYGAPPGELNPLPAWLGKPHSYDFTRFNVAYWQKADRAIRAMRNRGIVATCIFTIEKQNLPNEYGALTEHEQRLYHYAVARLAAFSNVWWDLGNEHNEYRKPEWTQKMGDLVKKWDPYDRLCSVHGYADWNYDNQSWADYIITQQYGDCTAVNEWALKYYHIDKPYVNEEYGYEGVLDVPKHGMNADWVRKCHWAIAMAGGYATYGDWSSGTAFYTGHIGQGKAPAQLRYLHETFESIPYSLMEPHNELVGTGAFCLAAEGSIYLIYLADIGETALNINPAGRNCTIIWIDPKTGKRTSSVETTKDKITLRTPSSGDWAAIVKVRR
ncbi:MAG: DUF4038 domain-containing protein [Sedimentisphaerales bacterium]|nr:DUF4038 domain-containing protein [Sedimentisphaerales bacterium]